MTKPLWARLKSTFSRAGRTPKERASSLSNKLNVDEEYKEAFRTKSYVEMWSKVQDQLRKTRIDGVNKVTSPSPSLPIHPHLSDYLFEPQQQGTLREMIEGLKFHHFLVDYFEASFEACHICDLLLQCIQQTVANNKKIRRVIKLGKRVQHSADYSDEISRAMYRELAAYALLENPLSIFYTTVKFNDFHDKNLVLLHGLTSEQRRIVRKAKFRRICMRVGGGCLVISHTALLIALLVIAIHGMAGIVAAPGIMGLLVLDIAAKGTYILINDFDTMSRLVRRLFDEVEHRKALADMCVRNKKPELLKEVVKEFHTHDLCYLEQLEELEQHIYLCFHTINRSRKLVMDEIMVAPDNSNAEDHQQKLLWG
ncbi:hypothetical protein DKX38_008623 [Salix brachista]|uniref:Uncharacterized protein n=1 Tax=Salix brachista TaxID=2182728 RepID=A0A5N5MRJ2_9ROSI|nr:hypothetical protein DKX38_008623 [Salix brachista]